MHQALGLKLWRKIALAVQAFTTPLEKKANFLIPVAGDPGSVEWDRAGAGCSACWAPCWRAMRELGKGGGAWGPGPLGGAGFAVEDAVSVRNALSGLITVPAVWAMALEHRQSGPFAAREEMGVRGGEAMCPESCKGQVVAETLECQARKHSLHTHHKEAAPPPPWLSTIE